MIIAAFASFAVLVVAWLVLPSPVLAEATLEPEQPVPVETPERGAIAA